MQFLALIILQIFCGLGFSQGGSPLHQDLSQENDDILSPFQSIGFFSQCSQQAASDGRGKFNSLAERFQHMVTSSLTYNKNYNFVSYDVCNDTILLVQLITDLILDRKYFLSNGNQIMTTNPNEVFMSRDQNIIFIIAYVTEEMAKILEDVAGNLHTTIARLCEPFQCDQRFPSFTMNDYIPQVSDFVTRFQMFDLTFVNFVFKGEKPTKYQAYYNKTYDLLRKTQRICLRKKTFLLDPRDFKTERHLQIMEQKLAPFLNSHGAQNSIPIIFGPSLEIHSLAALIKHKKDADQILPNRVSIFLDIGMLHQGDNENLINLFLSRRLRLFFIDAKSDDFTMSFKNVEEYVRTILGSIKQARLSNPDLNVGMIDKVYRRGQSLMIEFSYILPAVKYVGSTDQMKVLSEIYLSKEINVKPVHCPKLTCPPGYHKQYGAVNITINADEEHSFKCDLCPLNTIKVGFGDGPCVPCTGQLSIDNGKRTACIDPFTEVKMFFNDQQNYLAINLAGLGTIVTAFLIIVFFVRRDTPVVRSSDKVLSFLHLISLLGNFLGVICLYTLPFLEVGTCISRNLIYSIGYNLHVACLFIKSQKLVIAFSSKTRLSARNLRKTLLNQIFTVLILMLITNGCLFISYVQSKPDLVFQLDSEEMTRKYYCNTEHHQNMQILLVMVCQLACSGQAYRCRKLPDFMNQAMSLFYTVLITSVSFGISFPMSYFRRQPLDKSLLV